MTPLSDEVEPDEMQPDEVQPGALVVGAAIVRDGRLLAARRTTPEEAAGRWELPGGKVEPGESPRDAIVREVREELGCGVGVDRWLDGEQMIGATRVLRVALCRITDGEPQPGVDHDELRWLPPSRLGEVDWLEPDRPFLEELVELVELEEPEEFEEGEDLLRHGR